MKMKTIQSTEPLWTKSFVLLILGNLFVFMSFQMLIPTLPPYFKKIGASGLEIGLVTTLFSIGAVVIRPYIGYLLEYRHRKPLVLIGAVALFGVTFLYPISQVVIFLLAFRLIHGIAWGWSTTVNGTAAVDVVPNSRLGEGMGYFGLAGTVGMIIAPSVGIYLYQHFSFDVMIGVSIALSMISIILLALVKYQTPKVVEEKTKCDVTFSFLGSLVEKSSWYPAFVTLLATFGYGAIVTFIVIFGEERGIDQIFLFYLINALAATLVRPITGRWFDLRGPNVLIIFCAGLTFVGLWVLSFATSNLFIVVAGLLFGAGYGSLIPTLQSWTLQKTMPERRGVANGMFYSAIDMGIGLSGLVFGVVAQFVEIAVIFQVSSFFFIVVILLTLLEARKIQQRPQPEVDLT